MASDKAADLDSAIAQVLDIRSGVQHVCEALEQPLTQENKQHLAATLQEVARSVSAFAASWEGSLSSIVHALEGGSAGVKPEGCGDVATADGSGSKASSATWCSHVAHELDTALNEELTMPVVWGHSLRKRARTGPSPSEAQELADVIERVRAACPGMLICGVNGMGGMTKVAAEDVSEVRLCYPRILCVSVTLAAPGRPEPLRVVMDSADRAPDLDTWAPSAHHHVFRRVSALATRALAYFSRRAQLAVALGSAGAGSGGASEGQQAANGAFAGQGVTPTGSIGAAGSGSRGQLSAGAVTLEEVLLWVASYRDLFKRSCAVTGRLLALEPGSMVPLPPIFRPYMVSHETLLERAARTEAIIAYHMHAAPRELLGWEQEEDPPSGILVQLQSAA